MFQGHDFGRNFASLSLGGRPAIVNCMAQGPVGAHLVEFNYEAFYIGLSRCHDD